MPAETHQQRDPIDVEGVLDLLASLVGVDAICTESALLTDLHLDDDLSILHLWEAVVEECGERCVGELDLEEPRPVSLPELAQWFAGHLRGEPGQQPTP